MVKLFGAESKGAAAETLPRPAMIPTGGSR